MKTIEINSKKHGQQFVLLDDEDYEWVSLFGWCVKRGWNTFYARENNGGPTMHRIIMGAKVGEQIDHINHNGLDNRRENLRIVSNQQNHQNRGKHQHATSPLKGVSQHGEKWRAQISFGGKRLHLGLFHSELDAAKAYDSAALEYYGQYANPNFPSQA